MFNLVLEASFTTGVAPGSDDNVSPVVGKKKDRRVNWANYLCIIF